jgi:GT2 family glycosyltransferase
MSAERPTIGAVVVNFNGGAKVEQCVLHLATQTFPLKKVLVVDNGSTDDSLERIGSAFPDVEILELGRNTGISIARNAGMNVLETDLVLSVDADVYLAADCAERMAAALESTNATVVCPRILLLPGASIVQCDGATLHFLGTLGLRHGFRPEGELPREGSYVNGCIGACLLFRRAAVVDAGGFDELFHFYFEDLEFSLRMRSRGHLVYCEPAAVARHDRGSGIAGLSFRGAGKYPVRRAYYSMRHRWLSMLIHFRSRTLIVLTPALVLYEAATVVLSIIRGWLPAWASGWWWLMRHGKEIRERRQRARRARVLTDRDLLEGGPIPLAPGLFQSLIARSLVNVLTMLFNGYWRLVRSVIA